MEAFRFYQDRKVTCWERTHFEVTAENYEEAVAIVSSWRLYTSYVLVSVLIFV